MLSERLIRSYTTGMAMLCECVDICFLCRLSVLGYSSVPSSVIRARMPAEAVQHLHGS